MSPEEWAPGRAHFAITRLAGTFILTRRGSARRASGRNRLLVFQDWQNPAEAYVSSLAYLLFLFLLLFLPLFDRLGPRPVLVLLFVPLVLIAIILIHLVSFFFALVLLIARKLRLLGSIRNVDAQHVLHNVVFFVAAGIATTSRGSVRWAGYSWLALVALELVSRLATLLFRARIAAANEAVQR